MRRETRSIFGKKKLQMRKEERDEYKNGRKCRRNREREILTKSRRPALSIDTTRGERNEDRMNRSAALSKRFIVIGLIKIYRASQLLHLLWKLMGFLSP